MEVHRDTARLLSKPPFPLMAPEQTLRAGAGNRQEVGMKLRYDGQRLRIFVHESVRYGGRPAYEQLVERARRQGLAGATVFGGIEGFGLHRHVHATRLVDASDDLPVVDVVSYRPGKGRHEGR